MAEIKDLIQNTLDKDATSFQKNFNELMKQKVVDRFNDSVRKQVGDSISGQKSEQ